MMVNTWSSIFGTEEIYLVRHSTGVADSIAINALCKAYSKYGKDNLVNNAIIIIHGRYPRVYQDF